jgi:hypothetical protein
MDIEYEKWDGIRKGINKEIWEWEEWFKSLDRE